MLTVTGVTVTLTWGISIFCVAVPNLIHKSGCFRLSVGYGTHICRWDFRRPWVSFYRKVISRSGLSVP